MISWIPFILGIIGIVLSWYALHVGQYAGKKKGYQALCDVNDHVSCTKAFTSEYGKTFGVLNGFWGIIFYVLVILLSYYNETQYLFILSIFAVAASIYLAFLLYFRVKTMCVVCTSVYLINLGLLISSYVLGFLSA